MATVKKIIEAETEMLSAYDELYDNIIPWTEFKESRDELKKHRNDLTTKNNLFISEMKTHMMNAIDAQFHAWESVFEWSSLVASQLKLYIDLFNNYNAKKFEAQKQIIIEIFDNGMAQMNIALAKLDNSSFSLNSGGLLLATIDSECTRKWMAARKELYTPVRTIESYLWHDRHAAANTMQKMAAIVKISSNFLMKLGLVIRKIVLANELMRIKMQNHHHLRDVIQQTLQFVNFDEKSELRDLIVESVQQLITKCKKFQKKQKSKADLFRF